MLIHYCNRERFFGNLAQLLAAPFALASAKVIQITQATQTKEILNEFVRHATACIRRQNRIMSEKKSLAIFFEIIQQLFDQNQIREETHFKFKQEGDTCWLYIWFPNFYFSYAQRFRQIYHAAPAERDEIKTELAILEGYSNWEAMKRKERFRIDDSPQSTPKTQPKDNSCHLNYSTLTESFGLSLDRQLSNFGF